MRYTIKLVKGFAQFTAYEGTSVANAVKMVDLLRNVLIVTGATGDVCFNCNGGADQRLYEVLDGEARADMTLEAQ